MAKKPKTKRKQKALPAKKKPPIQVMKYQPHHALVAENAMLSTGTIEGTAKAMGISRQTLSKWIKVKPDLGSAIARAREERQTFLDRDFLPEHVAALRGLNILISGSVKKLTTVVEKDLFDRQDPKGKPLEILERRTTVAERYFPPDFRAIEKVLGANDLKHNVYIKALENHVLNNDSELYKLIFGKLASDDHGERFQGIFVLRLGLDMMKIRYMEAHIQNEYDLGNITMESWSGFLATLRRDYGQIADRMETRAQKLLGGVSYQEIVLRVENVWQSVIEAVEEAVGSTYEREGGKKPYTIPPDVQKQVVAKIVMQVRSRTEGGLPMLRNASVS